MTWDGWSLSAPRAGTPLSRHPDAPDPARPETLPAAVPNDPQTAMGLAFEAAVVPGSLPRLRFGRSYRLRMREVDLAGGGPTVADATALGNDAELGSGGYQRFEPVPAPAAVPAMRFGEGASLHRLVVRSDSGLDPDGYAAAFNAEQAGLHPGYAPADVRHLAPPKASYDLVEKHGLFDPAIGSDGQPPSAEAISTIAAAYAIARREKGTFDDPTAPDAEVVPIVTAGGEDGGRYVVRTGDQLELPYLPDPLATGVVFFGLPGLPAGRPLEIGFDGPTWYQARPIRLQLAGGDGPPGWDEANRLLTVRLPQAGTARIRMTSRTDRLDLLGMVAWCEAELAGDELDRVITAMKENRCWLTTPWHDIELVHAVQHPLETPVFEDFRVSRPFGATHADVAGLVSLHRPSTEKVDLVARWTDPVDDVRDDAPRDLDCRATVFTLPMATVERAANGDPELTPYQLIDGRVLAFNSHPNTDFPTTMPTPHRFGDTKYHRVSYATVATTPFREDFPVPWLDQPERLSVTSDAVTVDVLSSAPPRLPGLQYVVPTLGWLRDDRDGSVVSVRKGGGLRVWLDRGWWSSGAGELLGVVIGSDVIAPGSTDYPFVSLIGQDPIRAGAGVRNLREAGLRGQVTVAPNVRVAEDPEFRATVVGFAPTFDPTTDRWFCDIGIDTGDAYTPFVRLSLVRYQPHSLRDQHASGIVLADIVQPVPDRTATLTRNAADPSSITVTVAGPSFSQVVGAGTTKRSDDAVMPLVTAEVQRADPAITDDVLRWQTIDDVSATLRRSLAGGIATWAGELTTPADGGELRVLLTERERLFADGVAPGTQQIIDRVVYAAALPL